MVDIDKVLKGLACCDKPYGEHEGCPYDHADPYKKYETTACLLDLIHDAYEAVKELQTENKALRLLVDWAEECDFGYDQFPNEYEKYKDEIEDMRYIEGMIHIAKRTLEDYEKRNEE